MEYSLSKLVTKNSMSCFSPVGNVIGICTFFSTIEVVDLSNILSRMAFGRCENFNLFTIANASCTKLWEDPESRSAQKGWCGFWVEGEVRERKNEFREREEAFSKRGMLLGVGQPTQSTGQRGLPIHFPGQHLVAVYSLLARYLT